MALAPGQPLPPLDEALEGSEFEESLDCIQDIFDRLGINTVRALDNCPRQLTCAFCGISTHRLIQHIRAYMEAEPLATDVVSEVLKIVESSEEEE